MSGLHQYDFVSLPLEFVFIGRLMVCGSAENFHLCDDSTTMLALLWRVTHRFVLQCFTSFSYIVCHISHVSRSLLWAVYERRWSDAKIIVMGGKLFGKSSA